MNYITYSATKKTYSITSREIGMAMISMGNSYGHNRGGRIIDKAKALASLASAGFTEVNSIGIGFSPQLSSP